VLGNDGGTGLIHSKKDIMQIIGLKNQSTKKKAVRLPELPLTQSRMTYLATVVLPNRLRKRSTRPPNVSMDFCVPV